MSDDADSLGSEAGQAQWQRAMLACAVLAVDPALLGGAVLRGGASFLRDQWLEQLQVTLEPQQPWRRMPANIGDGRLLGGLDLAATLTAGRPISERGLLADAHGGIVVLAMAERLPPGVAAKIAAVLDSGEVVTERDGIAARSPARIGIIALDESLDDEAPLASCLAERLALHIDLRELTHRDHQGKDLQAEHLFKPSDILAARALLPHVTLHDGAVTSLCHAAAALGIDSLRRPMQALNVARILAALDQRETVENEDLSLAAALVLAPHATQIPQVETEQDDAAQEEPPETPEEPASQDEQPPPEDDQPEPDKSEMPPLDDLVLEAAKAALPPGLMAMLLAGQGRVKSRTSGRAGVWQKTATRGRQIGAKPGDPRSGARLDLVETLRTAAPWQKLRRLAASQHPGRILVRREDFRVARYKHRSEATTIFVVDASGSAALQRLTEAKGAVRLLLAECYIRRDEVALLAFRGQSSTLMLPPTRSLARAEKQLAAMPGGGGTPLATAIDSATELAMTIQRQGRTPAVIFMTDGRANITGEGKAGRPQAQADAQAAATRLRHSGTAALVIDTSAQPGPQAAAIAQAMEARYVPLPQADPKGLNSVIRALVPGMQGGRR